MANKAKKIPHIKPINNFAMLFVLSIFQLITGFEAASAHNDFSTKAMLANIVLIALEWVYVSLLYVIVHRRNFELEFIAFFLSGVGLTVIGSVNPKACFKQLIILAFSFVPLWLFKSESAQPRDVKCILACSLLIVSRLICMSEF